MEQSKITFHKGTNETHKQVLTEGWASGALPSGWECLGSSLGFPPDGSSLPTHVLGGRR